MKYNTTFIKGRNPVSSKPGFCFLHSPKLFCFATLLSLILSFGANAQMADKRSHEVASDSVWAWYNRKDFKRIYEQCTPELQENFSLEKSQKFFEKNLYEIYGPAQKAQWWKEETGYHAFIVQHNAHKVQLNLGVDSSGRIAFMQFLPYRPTPAFKRRNWLSDNKKADALDSLVDYLLSEYMKNELNCGVSIGLLYKGQVRYYNYGETAMNSKIMVSRNNLYEIGSISKTFCGILLGCAIAENKVKAGDDIRKYLPGTYPNLELNGKAITLQHLANHTAGFKKIPGDLMEQKGYDALNPYKHYTRQMLFNHLRTITPETEPGTVCNYSNMGMALLGIILEGVYNKSFAQLVEEKITGPAGMKNTGTGLVLNQAQKKSLVNGHNAEGEDTPHWDLGDMAAAGGILSSTEDMVQYIKANLQSKTSEGMTLSQQVTLKGRQTVGLAWFMKNTNQGNNMIWHNGATYGFTSFCAFIKEINTGLVVLSNASTHVDYIGIALMNFLEK